MLKLLLSSLIINLQGYASFLKYQHTESFEKKNDKKEKRVSCSCFKAENTH